jgi:hypothetical protein
MGHYATTCKAHKATASARSMSSAFLGAIRITSAHNSDKIDLVEVDNEKFLPDTGANIIVSTNNLASAGHIRQQSQNGFYKSKVS